MQLKRVIFSEKIMMLLAKINIKIYFIDEVFFYDHDCRMKSWDFKGAEFFLI